METSIEYFKDRPENFDDYYPCRHNIEYDLIQVNNWLGLFVFMHNADILHIKFMTLLKLIKSQETNLTQPIKEWEEYYPKFTSSSNHLQITKLQIT